MPSCLLGKLHENPG